MHLPLVIAAITCRRACRGGPALRFHGNFEGITFGLCLWRSEAAPWGGCRPPDPPPYSWGAPTPQTPRLGGCRPPTSPREVWGGGSPQPRGLGGGSPPGIRGRSGGRQPPRELLRSSTSTTQKRCLLNFSKTLDIVDLCRVFQAGEWSRAQIWPEASSKSAKIKICILVF